MVLLPALLASYCATATTAAAPRRWGGVDAVRFEGIKRLAVLTGVSVPAGEEGLTLMIKAMIGEINSSGRFSATSYRDVQVELGGIRIGLPKPESKWYDRMDSALAVSLGRKLQVDALCLVWLTQSGQETGERAEIQMFSTQDGKALGSFVTARRGYREPYASPGYTSRSEYSIDSNCQSMAKEAVAVLLGQLR
jgi:hypothetical protein